MPLKTLILLPTLDLFLYIKSSIVWKTSKILLVNYTTVIVRFHVRYKKHTTQIKYGLVIVWVFAMIYLIKALINYQTILDSTTTVMNEIEQTKQHTDFINNFLHPYLESDYAPYFLAHENNQLFPGEKIININYTNGEHTQALSWSETLSWWNTFIDTWETNTTPSNQWIPYLQSFLPSSPKDQE